METNMMQWSKGIINEPLRQAMPVMTYPGLSLVGGSLMDMISTAENQFACIKALGTEFPSAAALTIMDLSVEAEAFGCPVAFSDDEVPTVSAPIVNDTEAAHALQVPAVGTGRTQAYLEAARLAAWHFTDRPVFGGMIGPYSLTVRLRDMTQVMMDLLIEPETIHVLLEKCTSFLIEYATAFKRSGANGLIIAEPAAGLLSLDHCQEFSANYVRRIVEAVQDENFMVILHNCGNTTELVPSLLSTGVRGLHFGNAVDMTAILPQVPSDILAFGNVDPAGTLRNGTVEGVRTATLDLLAKTAKYRNFVLSSGCDVPPGTPIANVDSFFDALDEFNGVSAAHGMKSAS